MAKMIKVLACEWCGKPKVMAGLEMSQGEMGCSLTPTWKCPDDSCRGRQMVALELMRKNSEKSYLEGAQDAIAEVEEFQDSLHKSKQIALFDRLINHLKEKFVAGNFIHNSSDEAPHSITIDSSEVYVTDPARDDRIQQVVAAVRRAIGPPGPSSVLHMTNDGLENLLDVVEDFLEGHYQMSFWPQTPEK